MKYIPWVVIEIAHCKLIVKCTCGRERHCWLIKIIDRKYGMRQCDQLHSDASSTLTLWNQKRNDTI